jgi:hypothetical protein
VLDRLFAWNQEHFTREDSEAYPVIAVIEEAQSVLSSDVSEHNPFVEWTKEGRKYGLGSILVTQQPGSIPAELVSQADNFFVFHLLSDGDLRSLKAANAHFSDDLLSSLLNEPIAGNGIIWSSASGRPYPVSTRILDFGSTYRVKLPHHEAGAPPWAVGVHNQLIASSQDKRDALDAAIDAALAPYADRLKSAAGVPLGELGRVLKPVVVKNDAGLAANDDDAFREAMNQARRAVARLAPDGFVGDDDKVNNKVHLFWRPIAN